MKKILIGLILSTSMLAFAEDKVSMAIDETRAQVYEKNGVIIVIKGDAAKYMYQKGLEINGVHETYTNEDLTYKTEDVKYGNNTLCTKTLHDIAQFIPGKTLTYECLIAFKDEQIEKK